MAYRKITLADLDRNANPPKVNLAGQIIGRLTVLSFLGRTRGWRKDVYLCRCQCGEKIIVRGECLRSVATKSCGCFHDELLAARNFKHGKTEVPEFVIWCLMRRRCENEADESYKDYGGRGVRVCERWQSFASFYADMGPRPSPAHTIERKNNEIGYQPDNCVWATRAEQNANRRSNQMLTFNGITDTLTGWARRVGMNRGTLKSRINKHGWDVERALTTPVRIH